MWLTTDESTGSTSKFPYGGNNIAKVSLWPLGPDPPPNTNEKLNGNFKTGIQGVKYAWSWCFLLLNIKYRHYRVATSIFVKYCGLFKILESDFPTTFWGVMACGGGGGWKCHFRVMEWISSKFNPILVMPQMKSLKNEKQIMRLKYCKAYLNCQTIYSSKQ